MQTDEIKQFLDTFDVVTDLEPREAFWGGCCNGFELFHKALEDQTIEYSDFPFVNKTKVYPLGHPTIICESFEDISNYLGLIKCRVLAPSQLLYPILPVRAKGKLFPPFANSA